MLYGMEDISRDLLHLPNTSDKLRRDEFWAVDKVSFKVKRGECLGIIGRNGAGKSTLLKMLNGIIQPDKGKITIKGKVGALIEVGAGFHPMLTGRENVYVNGAILGMSKREIDKKFDEIVAFAELEEFIDMPVKHYSSGMYVRLGFAIATQIQPDILILDEVLAVGDVGFRQKCLARMSLLMSNTAVVFVSHETSIIQRICTRGILLKNGNLQIDDIVDNVLNSYNENNQQSKLNEKIIFTEGLNFIKIKDKLMYEKSINFGESIDLIFSYNAQREFISCLVVLTFSNNGTHILQSHNIYSFEKGMGELKINVDQINLANGIYELSLTIMENHGRFSVASWLNFGTIRVKGKVSYGIYNQAPLSLTITR
jgi:lipopolysaccharide transport system ATP-binding protein